MEGRLHKAFQTYMDEHYKRIGNKKNGKVWVSVVIQTIWTKLFSQMWDNRNNAVHCITQKAKKKIDLEPKLYDLRIVGASLNTNFVIPRQISV